MGFLKNTKTQNMTERQKLTSRYNSARHNILLVIAFTLVNCVLYVVGSSSYFLFSAAIPYYLVIDGFYFTGKMPVEWYDVGFQPEPDSFLYLTVAIAVIIVALYGLFWFLSKKHGYGWPIVALIFFAVDTLAMFYFSGFTADMILDFVFHVWVLVSLCSGVISAINLKKLSEEEPYLAQEGQTYSYIPQTEEPVVQEAEIIATEENVEEIKE